MNKVVGMGTARSTVKRTQQETKHKQFEKRKGTEEQKMAVQGLPEP